MATIVNLNLGGELDPDGGGYTVDLVLRSPYEEPSPRLLVLRSSEGVAAVTGDLAVTEQRDSAFVEAVFYRVDSPSFGAWQTTGRADTPAFLGTTAPPVITGTLSLTEQRRDVVTGSGDGYVGIAGRSGVWATVGGDDAATDFIGVWTMRWRVFMAAVDRRDVGIAQGAFLPYSGPGFLNTTERRDGASAIGSLVYDVSGTADTQESPDTSVILAITSMHDDVQHEDAAYWRDTLAGDVEVVSLVDRIIYRDLLEDDQGMTVYETGVFSEVLGSVLRVTLSSSDVAVFRDSLGAAFVADSVEAFHFSDVLQSVIDGELEEAVRFTDVLGSQLSISAALFDTGVFRDVLRAHIDGAIQDAFYFSDTLDSVILDFSDVLEDRVAFHDALDSVLSVSVSVNETIIFQDNVESMLLAEIVDTTHWTDTLYGSLHEQLPVLTDTIFWTDDLAGTLLVYAPLLTEAVRFTDTLGSTLQLVGILEEVSHFNDDLLTEEGQTQIVVINAETGAVSTYRFTPKAQSVVDFNGRLYLAGPDGLYAMDSTVDPDGNVSWSAKTGFSNLGTDRLKRVQDINVQARTELNTVFSVTTDRYGDKYEWNYQMPPLKRTSYRDGVVKPGKGIHSVYWQFGLSGDGPTEIDQLRLVVEPLSRRR